MQWKGLQEMANIQGVLLSCPPKDRENSYIYQQVLLSDWQSLQAVFCVSFTFQNPLIFAVLQLEKEPIN